MSDHCAASEVAGAPDCHCGSSSSKTLVADAPRIALAGAPNAGKTSIYNALTGLRAKTGNYPGVTVTRSLGTCRAPTPWTRSAPTSRSSTMSSPIPRRASPFPTPSWSSSTPRRCSAA